MFETCLIISFLIHSKALWRAFDDGLIDNDEKPVASSKKHTQSDPIQKPYPIWEQTEQNWYPIFDQNG